MTTSLLTLFALVCVPGSGADPIPANLETPTVAACCPGVGSELLPAVLNDGPWLLGEAREFYPTGPGDTWTYESSVRGRFTNQVAGSIPGEGSGAYRIRSTESSGREHTFMVLQDGSRLYVGPDLESLSLLADFSLEVGSSSLMRLGTQEATLTLAGRHDTLDVFGTRFEDVVEIHIAPAAGGTRIYYFARGIGMVGMQSEGQSDRVRLATATVGGRTVLAAQDPLKSSPRSASASPSIPIALGPTPWMARSSFFE
jgi:hypothetical protein